MVFSPMPHTKFCLPVGQMGGPAHQRQRAEPGHAASPTRLVITPTAVHPCYIPRNVFGPWLHMVQQLASCKGQVTVVRVAQIGMCGSKSCPLLEM